VNDFEGFSINAHANGGSNPNAMFRNRLREGAFAKAPLVSEPVNLFDRAPDADGAAAVVLVASETAADLVPKPIRISGSAAATDMMAVHDRSDILVFNAVTRSTQKALQQAGIDRYDVDFAELHDSFTIVTALSLESAGFARRGEGWQMANSDAISRTGNLPISTFGGLKSRGNPAGATGLYQAVEAVLQLRNEAGDNQIADARVAFLQNLGGLASTAIIHILQV
jgi:acetyl-CoA C-acetyltransferase